MSYTEDSIWAKPPRRTNISNAVFNNEQLRSGKGVSTNEGQRRVTTAAHQADEEDYEKQRASWAQLYSVPKTSLPFKTIGSENNGKYSNEVRRGAGDGSAGGDLLISKRKGSTRPANNGNDDDDRNSHDSKINRNNNSSNSNTVVDATERTPTDVFALLKTEKLAISSIDAMMSRLRATSFMTGNSKGNNRQKEGEKRGSASTSNNNNGADNSNTCTITRKNSAGREGQDSGETQNMNTEKIAESGSSLSGIAKILSAQQMENAQRLALYNKQQALLSSSTGGIKRENAAVLEDYRESQQIASNMEKWLERSAVNDPEYMYEMSKVGGNDFWRPGDPAPYQIPHHPSSSKYNVNTNANDTRIAADRRLHRMRAGGEPTLPVGLPEGVTVSSTGSSFDALFSATAEVKFRKQLEKEEEHFPHYGKMREWITKRMVPLEEHHSLTNDAMNINNMMRGQWSRHCLAPAPVPAKPLYTIPNTYPDAQISSLPIPPAPSPFVHHNNTDENEFAQHAASASRADLPTKKDPLMRGSSVGATNVRAPDLFATFVDNKHFVGGDVTQLDADNRRSNTTGEMFDKYKVNDEFMPWLKYQNVAPFAPEISSDPKYIPPEAQDVLFDPPEEDPLEGFPFAERLARSRRLKKEAKRRMAEPKWIRWEDE